MAALLLTAIGLAALAAAAGVGYYHGGSVDIKPRFNQLSQWIRYHDTFHDSHSHDGYGHGYHGGNSGHVHDAAGDAVAPDPMQVIRMQAGPRNTGFYDASSSDQMAPGGADATDLQGLPPLDINVIVEVSPEVYIETSSDLSP